MIHRRRFGVHLDGDVLEIGPGSIPFPTAIDARVVYADKSVSGGRDATWPELAGQPSGPQAHYDLDLDARGLANLADDSLDGVAAAHVLEHLANPVRAITEMMRVLRPGGKLAIVMPERRVTFDSVRSPTTFEHVLDEHRQGVVDVSDEHIAEFCAAIYDQPPMHPPEVREWHNPALLDAERYDLHRRRSIHVHCWSAEEFAALLAGLMSQDLMAGRLIDLYFHDDGGDVGNEYGLLIEKLPQQNDVSGFVRDWTLALTSDPARDLRRAASFTAALSRDIDDVAAAVPCQVLGEQVVAERELTRQLHTQVAVEQENLRQEQRNLAAIVASRSYRLGTRIATPARRVRSLARRVPH